MHNTTETNTKSTLIFKGKKTFVLFQCWLQLALGHWYFQMFVAGKMIVPFLFAVYKPEGNAANIAYCFTN